MLRDTLTREVRTAARLRAAEVATDLRSGALPAELAVGATTPGPAPTGTRRRPVDLDDLVFGEASRVTNLPDYYS